MDYIEGTKKEISPGLIQVRRTSDYALLTLFKGTVIVIRHLSGRLTLISDQTPEHREAINQVIHPHKIPDTIPWQIKVGYNTYPYKEGMSIHRSYKVVYKEELTIAEQYENRREEHSALTGGKVFTSLKDLDHHKEQLKRRIERYKLDEAQEARKLLNKQSRMRKNALKTGKDTRSQCLTAIFELLE